MENLKTCRINSGLTQLQLAKACGLSDVCISNIERGKFNANDKSKAKIEKALGCKVDWLQTGTIKLQSPDLGKAEKLLRKLLAIKILLSQNEQVEFNKLITYYLKN